MDRVALQPSVSPEELQSQVQTLIAPFKLRVKRKAKGMLRHDYLVPGGPYEEQWDWDAFFIAMALSSEFSSEGIYLRNWALNYISNSQPNGFTPGLVTPQGPDTRLNQMKPLLAQGSYFASNFLQDFDWLKKDDIYARLKNVVLYRENNGFFNPELGLGMWTNSMESGADNNLASLEYPDTSVASVDFNSFLYMEYKAMEHIATALGNAEDLQIFSKKATALKDAILSKLWCEEEQAFCNRDIRDGSFIRVVSYSAVHPFWAGIATQEQANAFFKRHLLNINSMRSPYGIRTLSKEHPGYNNVNMIKPHSNWQGPIWPIATYIYAQSLMNYGHAEEALQVAKECIQLCLEDIRTSGGMHENYDAETGLPLAAPNFISWNLLLLNVLQDIQEKRNPFKL